MHIYNVRDFASILNNKQGVLNLQIVRLLIERVSFWNERVNTAIFMHSHSIPVSFHLKLFNQIPGSETSGQRGKIVSSGIFSVRCVFSARPFITENKGNTYFSSFIRIYETFTEIWNRGCSNIFWGAWKVKI